MSRRNTPTWNRVQGDIGDTIVITLDGVADLDGVTQVRGHVWRPNGTDKEILSADVTDPTTRTVTVQLGDATGWLSDAAPTVWLFELETVWASGETLTWPEAAPAQINVRPQGDPPSP